MCVSVCVSLSVSLPLMFNTGCTSCRIPIPVVAFPVTPCPDSECVIQTIDPGFQGMGTCAPLRRLAPLHTRRTLRLSAYLNHIAMPQRREDVTLAACSYRALSMWPCKIWVRHLLVWRPATLPKPLCCLRVCPHTCLCVPASVCLCLRARWCIGACVCVCVCMLICVRVCVAVCFDKRLFNRYCIA